MKYSLSEITNKNFLNRNRFQDFVVANCQHLLDEKQKISEFFVPELISFCRISIGEDIFMDDLDNEIYKATALSIQSVFQPKETYTVH